MKITSLGHGGAFASYAQGNSSFLIEEGNEKILFDCGPLTPLILRDEMGIDLFDIDYIYISHTHADHIGGLPLLLQHRFWIPRENKKKPVIVAHPDVMRELLPLLKNELEHANVKDNIPAGVSLFFDYVAGDRKYTTRVGGFEISLVVSLHTVRKKDEIDLFDSLYKPCYGAIISKRTKPFDKVYLSADTAFFPQFRNMEDYTSLILDCETIPKEFESKVHLRLEDIIANNIYSRTKIYLTHYSNESSIALPENIEYFTKGKSFTI